MPSVTTYYGITEPVPFIDVEVTRDNLRFLDPHAIRLDATPPEFARIANIAMTSYFVEITRCALSQSTSDRKRGLELLQRFGEPCETRLGMARNSVNGHGGAKDVGEWIWAALTGDAEALLRVGLLQELEALPLFVEGIGPDITSDITTRIVYEALAMFTAHIVETFPQFSSNRHAVRSFERQIWDPDALSWTTKRFELPVAANKPLLLVPLNWARPGLLMTSGRFYGTTVLSYAQREQTVFVSGHVIKPSKDTLKTQASLARGRITNLGVTLRAHDHGEDLIAAFKEFVDTRYAPADEAA